MTAVRKFLFDTNFDAGEPAAETPERGAGAAPAAPSQAREADPGFSAEDLEQARSEGFAAGRAEGEAAARQAAFEEGRAAGQSEAEQAGVHLAAEALTLVGQRLQALLDQRAQTADEARELALTVLRAALGKLCPVVTARHGLEEVEALLADCLTRLGEEPRVVVRVADDLYDTLDGRLGDLTRRSGFEGKVVLLSEPELTAGDLRVEWADGGAERDTATLLRDLDDILDRALGASPAPADAPAAPSGSAGETQEG